ncbi:C2 domain-containing protein [Hordeum vulgare]|nr:C2 domain-containing protein [Hordeum vulgare]
MTTAPSGKGKPRAPRKTAAMPKPKKMLMPEQRAKESANRKGRRHAAYARDEAIAAVVAAAAAQQEVTHARVAAATREALYMLGLNPSQHDLVNAAVAAASTGSSAFPRMAFQALEAFKVQHNDKCFNLSHCFRIIKDEESLRRNMPLSRCVGGGGEASRVGGWGWREGTAAGKTNSKKEDKQDVASNALIASVEGMMSKKDSREEERRCYKEEQMNAFMEIQRRRLEMNAEKQAKMLEMEAEKQARMLEIEAANAKTKAKEVALTSMMTGVEIMKVDLNTMSPRKRLWFKKMQANMLKFGNE